MDKIQEILLRSQNAIRSGAIAGYGLVGIIVVALAVIGLLYLVGHRP